MSNSHRSGQFFILGLILLITIAFADQYLKWFVIESSLRIDGDMIPFGEWFTTQKKVEYFIAEREQFNDIVLLPILNIVMVWNKGISFGLLDSDSKIMGYILITLSIAITLGLIIWLAVTQSKLHSLAIGLIAGGAIGNVIDRIRFGAVADFIDLHYNDLHWPAFNLADAAIVIGAICFIIGFKSEKTINEPVDV